MNGIRATVTLCATLAIATSGCSPTPTVPSTTARPTQTSAAAATVKPSPAASPARLAAVGRLAPTGAMAMPRAVATATRLVDGRVMIAGGCTDSGCDLGSAGGETAELYDPAAGTFSRTGDLTVWRDDHAAIALPDGRVLLVGGWGADGLLDSTDVYDPATGSFAPGPPMHSGRAGDVPVELADGRVLIAGGFLGNRPTTTAAEVFDPTSLKMTPTGDLGRPRGAYAAARLADGRVLVAGGLSDGVVTPTAELYDPQTGTFSATGDMAIPRYKGGAIALPDGRILVFAGSGDIDGTITYNSSELYDPATGTFSPGPTMAHARYKVAESTIRLGSGDYLLTAGAPEPELFDVAALAFRPVEGSLGATRLFLAAAPIDDHRVLLSGGYDRVIRPTDQAWVFDDRE